MIERELELRIPKNRVMAVEGVNYSCKKFCSRNPDVEVDAIEAVPISLQ